MRHENWCMGKTMGESPNLFFDRQGRVICHCQYLALRQDEEYMIVKKSKLEGLTVSTVWLGLDVSLDQNPKEIFETMVFSGGWDGYQERYSTERQAIKGHDEIVQLIMDRKSLLERAKE